MNLENFIQDLSSDKPIPGGGSTSALFGVLASALSSMVCALTYNKKNYEQYQDFVKGQHKKILNLKDSLDKLIDKDMQAYLKLNNAYKLPKDTQEQIGFRNKQIQTLLRPAAEVPLEIMNLSAQGIDITNSLIGKTNKLALSDLACAAIGFKSAIQCAWLNVLINLSLSSSPMDDLKSEGEQLINKYISVADEIYYQTQNSF